MRPPATFQQQITRAVTRAGGDPLRIGHAKGTPRTGRFNARGRGSNAVATFPRENGWSRREGGMRFRARRVIVKARIKTRPIQQWMVGREFNRRLKRRFDELGIEIPYPHTTLYFGADKQGRAAAANLSVDLPALVEALAAGFGRMERPSETREEERERPPAASPTPTAAPAAPPTPAKPPSPVPDLRDDDAGM